MHNLYHTALYVTSVANSRSVYVCAISRHKKALFISVSLIHKHTKTLFLSTLFYHSSYDCAWLPYEPIHSLYLSFCSDTLTLIDATWVQHSSALSITLPLSHKYTSLSLCFTVQRPRRLQLLRISSAETTFKERTKMEENWYKLN